VADEVLVILFQRRVLSDTGLVELSDMFGSQEEAVEISGLDEI